MDEELEGLSAEEIAALADDEADDDTGIEEVDDNETDLDEADSEADEVDETNVDDKEVTAKVDDDTNDPDGIDESLNTNETKPDFQPQYKVEAPEDLSEQLSSVTDKMNELDEQLEDGDIDLTDYRRQMREYSSQREELITLRTKAEIANDMSQQSAQQRWEWEQDMFMGEASSAIYKNRAMHAALNETVKEVANEKGWNDKSGLDVLRESDRRVKEMMGVKSSPKLKVVEPMSKPDIPKTLRDIPAAEGNESGDEFAALDKLDGMELESALARLSDEQRDRYLTGT